MSTTTTVPASITHDRRAAWLVTRLDVTRRHWEQHATIGTADGRLLWLFTDRRPRTLREISDALGLEQSTVNRQVNAAIAGGLLQRHSEPGRSAQLVEPTDVGIDTFERAVTHSLGPYEAGIAALPADQAEHFLDLLTTFVDGYAAAAEPSEPETAPAD